METILHGFNKTSHGFSSMSRMTIHNQKDRPGASMKKPFNEINKLGGIDPTLHRHESELPLSTDRRNDVQTKPGPGAADDRRFSFLRPSGACVMIRANSRFISKEYQRLLFMRQFLDPGILFLQPFLDSLRFLLISTPNRTLRCQTQLAQQTTHGSLAQLHAKSLMNKLSHHLCRPKRIRKLQLQRILVNHRLVYPLQRFAIQFRLSSASLFGVQGVPAAPTIAGQPTVYRDTVNPQCFCYNLRTLSFLHAAYASLSQFRQRLMIKVSCIHCFHAYRTITYKLLCQYNYETVNKCFSHDVPPVSLSFFVKPVGFMVV